MLIHRLAEQSPDDRKYADSSERSCMSDKVSPISWRLVRESLGPYSCSLVPDRPAAGGAGETRSPAVSTAAGFRGTDPSACTLGILGSSSASYRADCPCAPSCIGLRSVGHFDNHAPPHVWTHHLGTQWTPRAEEG
ncbi:hypothetical protein FA95DRAFT_1561048 [Auriscalpium vulgare]|uniref:Uncharacterized protein n=1 Tax=Auriscalpium vulgare TaxID=40419 RepID=A0ACB8RMX7_9AGAM|nr:hypothetical protein FA95DRAFT_1561048 [Auriscalpium vulgare]